MAGRSTRFNQLFDKYKNQGLTDDEAMKKAMTGAQKETEGARKAEAKKKPTWVEKLKMGVTKQLKSKYHSPAGRKHKKGY